MQKAVSPPLPELHHRDSPVSRNLISSLRRNIYARRPIFTLLGASAFLQSSNSSLDVVNSTKLQSI
ncbi:hypothetical protein DY000_02030627 [Brassica cretica]|uniref:Uncharacterized protein n=1 Tax=Brassica cretica TaxID=69181 RepID=A0ABQ7DEK2_BRACR|nr:hypothetical protein DY000_02030627 [Brassica cretica]